MALKVENLKSIYSHNIYKNIKGSKEKVIHCKKKVNDNEAAATNQLSLLALQSSTEDKTYVQNEQDQGEEGNITRESAL